MLPIRTILHPTDFTEHARVAFQMACALARSYEAKLVIQHVFPTPIVPIVDGSVFPVPVEIPRKALLAELDKLQAPDYGVTIERILIEGDPVFEILRTADNLDADLIVMGTHGRGGLSRLVMGSVAERVTRKASCPVLTVRAPAGLDRANEAKSAREGAGWSVVMLRPTSRGAAFPNPPNGSGELPRTISED